jgi:DNA-binding YbaB/EbfC family protein
MKARLPKGMGGGPQNMQSMIKQAQQMQEKMEAKQAELKEREFTAAAGGGAVSVKMNGAKEILELTLKPEVVDPEDIEMLQDLVISAVNECTHNIDEISADELEAITGGLSVPGMF